MDSTAGPQDAVWVGSVTGQGDGTSWGSVGNSIQVAVQFATPFDEEDNLFFYNFSLPPQADQSISTPIIPRPRSPLRDP